MATLSVCIDRGQATSLRLDLNLDGVKWTHEQLPPCQSCKLGVVEHHYTHAGIGGRREESNRDKRYMFPPPVVLLVAA